MMIKRMQWLEKINWEQFMLFPIKIGAALGLALGAVATVYWVPLNSSSMALFFFALCGGTVGIVVGSIAVYISTWYVAAIVSIAMFFAGCDQRKIPITLFEK